MREIGPRPAGDHPDPAHWQRIRAAALARDGTCRLCREPSQLECHHNTYARWGREALDDVIILCRGCHDAITGAQMRRRDEQRRMPAQRIMNPIERLAPTLLDPMPELVRVAVAVEQPFLPPHEAPPPLVRELLAIDRLAPPVAAGLPPPARNQAHQGQEKPWTASATSTCISAGSPPAC